MSDLQDDPFAVTFGRFRAEVDAVVSPIGVTATRVEVHRRHRRRGVAVAIAAVVAIAVPVAIFAVGGHHHAPFVPSGSPSPSPAASSGTADRTAATSIAGTLTWVARTGPLGSAQNATVITVTGDQIAEQHIGPVVWGDATPDVAVIALAPDGERMAFQGNDLGGGLNVADINGDSLVDVDEPADRACGAPAWSPGSSKIVYARGLDAGTEQITVVNPDGTGRQTLGTGCHPVFSVDGSQVAYVDNAGGLDVVNVDGTGHRVVTGKLGPAGIQTITSFNQGHAIVDLGTGPCCDSGDVRHLRLIDPRLVDMATGAVGGLPSAYGTVAAAFYVKSGGMVLRVTAAADHPGKIVFLSFGGAETAVFDESQLSLPGYPVTSLNIDLVGAQP